MWQSALLYLHGEMIDETPPSHWTFEEVVHLTLEGGPTRVSPLLPHQVPARRAPLPGLLQQQGG